MPNIQILNLADVYAKADQAKAMQQNATLRDLQTQQLLHQQQQDVGLSDLAKRSMTQEGMDLDAMSRGAAEMGAYQPAMEFEKQGLERKKQKTEVDKGMLNLLGQSAYVKNDVHYQTWLGEMDRINPQIAKQMRATDPVYSPAVENKLRQVREQSLTEFQRQSLSVSRENSADRLAAKENAGLKASDTNALMRLTAQTLNLPFTPQPDGSIVLSALNPEQASKFASVMGRASQNFAKDKRDHASAFNRALDELRPSFPDLPVIKGLPRTNPVPTGVSATSDGSRQKQLSIENQQSALRKWQNPENRQIIMDTLTKDGYDTTFLTGKSAQPPAGSTLPIPTVRPTEIVDEIRNEREWLRRNASVFRGLSNSRVSPDQAKQYLQRIQVGLGSNYYRGEDRRLAEQAVDELSQFTGGQ